MMRRRRGVSPVIASILLIVIVVASSAAVYSVANSLGSVPQSDVPAILESLKIIQVSADANTIYLFILNRGGVDATVDSIYVESCTGELLLRQPVHVYAPAGETVNVTIPRGGLDLSKPLNFKIGTQRGASTSALSIVQTSLTSTIPSLYEYFPSAYFITAGTYVTGILPAAVQQVDGSYFTIASAPSAHASPAYLPASYSVQTGSYVNGTVTLLSSQDSQSMYFLSSASTQISRTYDASGYNALNGTLISGSLPDIHANDTESMTFGSQDSTSTSYPVQNMNFTFDGEYWQASFSETTPSDGPSSVTDAASDFVSSNQRTVARTNDTNRSIHVIYTDTHYLRYAISVDNGASFIDHTYISDGAGGGEIGMHPTIASDINNNLHVAYERIVSSPTEIGYILFNYNSSYGGNPRTASTYREVTGDTILAAHFIALSSDLATVQLYLQDTSHEAAPLTVELRMIKEDGTPDLSESGLIASTVLEKVPASFSWVEATLKAELKPGSVYALVLSTDKGIFRWGCTAAGYTGTRGGWSCTGGTWQSSAAENFCFAIPGWSGWTFSTPTTVRSVSTGTALNRPAIAVYPYLTGQDQSFAAGTSTAAIYSSNYYAQSFTPAETELAGMMLYLSTVGSPDHLYVEVRLAEGTVPDMSDAGLLTSGYIDRGRASSSARLYDCVFVQGAQLNASQTYWLVLKSPSSSASNYWRWYYNAAGGYAGGDAADSSNGGGAWTVRAWDFRFTTLTTLDERPAIAWYYQAPTGTNRLRIEFLRCIPNSDPTSQLSWRNRAGTSSTPDILYQATSTDTTTRVTIATQPNTNVLYFFFARSGTLRYNRIYNWNPATGNWDNTGSASSILTGVSDSEISAAPDTVNNTVVVTAVSSATGYTNVYYYTSSNTQATISPASTSMRNASVSVIAGRIYVVYNNGTNISYQYYDGAWSGEFRFYNGSASYAPNAVYAPRASSVDFVWFNDPSSILYGSAYPTGIVSFTGPTYDSGNGNPSGSGGGSLCAQVDDRFVGYSFYRANWTFYSEFTTPSIWDAAKASFAWQFNLSGSGSHPYGEPESVTLYSVRLIVADSSGKDLFTLYTDSNSGTGWIGTSAGYFYRTGINANYSAMMPATTYRLKVVFDLGCSDPADLSRAVVRIDDVGIVFQRSSAYIDLEFYGSSDTDDWGSVYIETVSNITAVPVDVLVRVYNYALDRYPLSGEEGYFRYTVTTPGVEEGRSLQISSGANDFRAPNGTWRVSISGNASLAGFEFGLDMLNFVPRVNVYSVSVEFTGASDLDDWLSLLWNSTQAFSESSVGVTVQLYNYTASAYPSSGAGFYAYTSGPAYTYESVSNTTLDFTHFRDGSGNWKVLVTATKVGEPFYMLNDYMLYSPTKISQQIVDAYFTWTGIGQGNMLNITYSVTSLFNVSSVDVTFQIWDYSTASWSGVHAITYTSDPAPNTPQTAQIVVTSDLQRYVSSGEARIRVYAAKSQPGPFSFSADQLEFTVWTL